MDKRYQVFISSTYTDLLEERQEVIQALLELDCIPAGMELFPATDDDQWTLIKKVIDDCDYYIIIVGGRYGSLSSSGISYTEMEYDYAISQRKPVISFIHKDPGTILSSKTEDSTDGKIKLEAFRKKVGQKMCKHWLSPAELGSVVSRSLVKLIKNNPAIGWVRADLVPEESSVNEINRLQKQVDYLENQLDTTGMQKTKDTESLAQGDDIFKFEYEYYTWDDEWQGPAVADFSASWTDIFSIVSTVLMNEASEEEIRVALASLVYNSFHDLSDEEHIGKISINDYDFTTIIIQLRALGLIIKNSTVLDGRSKTISWTLTTYGDIVMTKLRAIKKTDLLPTALDEF